MNQLLPIEEAIPDLLRALGEGRNAVLQAPPGAGKTTRVPLALLDAAWLGGRRVVVLEPRRLAVRAAARRMAATLGEEVGETVGYRVRLESRVGPRTRVEVVTEGVLTRMIQDDPELSGIGAVLFDEFHERNLHSDLGLALCLEAQAALREDLRIVAMSATLDGAAVARLMGDAPTVVSQGRSFAVETRYQAKEPQGRIEDTVAAAIRRALAEETGSLLVFLPGEGEIRRVEAMLRDGGLPSQVLVAPLYGNLPQDAQDRAIAPAPPGVRKVVLATAIAETSLTIESVRVVVDLGLMRVPRFEPRTGMTRLETVRVTKASADQRRGRAGRLEPGVCYRLWTEAGHAGLPPHAAPEIAEADLAPLVLELALWGAPDVQALPWLTPPPAAAVAQARDLLERLGALGRDGRIAAHGRRMAKLGLHPRLAHMILAARGIGQGGLACDIAALLSERDILRGRRECDLRTRIEVLHAARAGRARRDAGEADQTALRRVLETVRHVRRQAGVELAEEEGSEAGLVLAFAYPDRIARRRPGGRGQYLLANGRGAVLPEGDSLAAEEWLAVADLDAGARDARIFQAAPLTLAEIEAHFGERIATIQDVRWDGREEAVVARKRRCLDSLILADEPLPNPDPEAIAGAILQGIREMGPSALPWTKEPLSWRARVAFLRRVEGEPGGWPDVSDEALLASLEDWLAPFLGGVTRRAHLARVDLGAALRGLLDWRRQALLDERAPTHLAVPSGSRVPVDYDAGETPVLAVRLQEMFGATDTPRVAGGRVPVLLHLLSPARRPVQVTQDLASFWANGYRAVKADLRGQYPKHFWPDDPLRAEPTSRVRPRNG